YGHAQDQGQQTYRTPSRVFYKSVYARLWAFWRGSRPTCLPVSYRKAFERYQSLEPVSQTGRQEHWCALAQLAHRSKDSRDLTARSGRIAGGRSSAAGSLAHVHDSRYLHATNSRTSAGSRRESGANGDEW